MAGLVLVSGRRYELGVVLSPPLGCKKVIVAAARAFRIAAAHRRTGVIDRALPLLRVKKHADFPEDIVLLMPEYSANGGGLRITTLGLLVRNAKVIRYSKQVALGYLDAIITATIRRAL